MSNFLLTPLVRFAFVQVFEADEKGKFKCCLIFDEAAQKTSQFKALKKAANDAVKAKWGDKPPAKLRTPFRTGDNLPTNAESGERYEGFENENFVAINVTTKQKPDVVDNNVEPILSRSGFKSGDFGIAAINAFCYDVDGSKGVSFGLYHVQKTKDGDSLGGSAPSAKDVFGVVEDNDDSDDDIF